MISNVAVISLLIYKLLSMATGFAICLLGYKLFLNGISGPVGPAEGRIGNAMIRIAKCSPGIMFCILGSGIIVYTIQHGFDISAATGSTRVLQVVPDTLPTGF